jgi:hypothetical protein
VPVLQAPAVKILAVILAVLSILSPITKSEEVTTVKKQVVTWQSPRGKKIHVTPKQEKIARQADVWPRDASGEEYCQVAYGLHYDEPTYTDAEWAELVESLKR